MSVSSLEGIIEYGLIGYDIINCGIIDFVVS